MSPVFGDASHMLEGESALPVAAPVVRSSAITLSAKFFVCHQASLGAIETIASVHSIEREALFDGVQVKQHHANNGVFALNAFREASEDGAQAIKLSSIGTKHQNGVAEHSAGTAWSLPVAFCSRLRSLDLQHHSSCRQRQHESGRTFCAIEGRLHCSAALASLWLPMLRSGCEVARWQEGP